MMRFKQFHGVVLLIFLLLVLSACSTTTTKTVQLSQIAQNQAIELQKSHMQFVQRYFQKLRDDINDFIENKWVPLFLSKAVNNSGFRKDLDEAYLLSNIEVSDIKVQWKGKPLSEPYKSAVMTGVENVIADQRGRLGKVLLDFTDAAQVQINKIRKDLLGPINKQEKMVINEINGAWTDLLAAQASITSHLESVVEVKKSQDEVLKKMGVLEKRDKIMAALLEYSDKFTDLLAKKEDAEKIIEEFKEKFKEFEKKIAE